MMLQIARYLSDHPQLLDDGNSKKVCRVLDILVGKMMKSHDTNEVRITQYPIPLFLDRGPLSE